MTKASSDLPAALIPLQTRTSFPPSVRGEGQHGFLRSFRSQARSTPVAAVPSRASEDAQCPRGECVAYHPTVAIRSDEPICDEPPHVPGNCGTRDADSIGYFRLGDAGFFEEETKDLSAKIVSEVQVYDLLCRVIVAASEVAHPAAPM